MKVETITVPATDRDVATITLTGQELRLLRDIFGTLHISKTRIAYDGIDVYPLYIELDEAADRVGLPDTADTEATAELFNHAR